MPTAVAKKFTIAVDEPLPPGDYRSPGARSAPTRTSSRARSASRSPGTRIEPLAPPVFLAADFAVIGLRALTFVTLFFAVGTWFFIAVGARARAGLAERARDVRAAPPSSR